MSAFDGADDGPKGLVRVNTPPTLAQAFLVERLALLAAAHPKLDIDVATDVREVSLERRETDIALRLAKPPDGDVIARRLATLRFGLYGSESACVSAESGNEPVFVGFDEANASLPEAVWLRRQFPKARMSLRTSSQLSQAAAARTGAGLLLLPQYVGHNDPRLRPCRIEHQPFAREVWMITRRQDRKDLSVQVVSEFLVRVFADERHLFD